MEKPSLQVEVAGLKFRNPFIISSGPASKSVEQLIQAEEVGWAGVSIKLTFDPYPYINLPPRYRWLKDLGIHIFSAERRLVLKEGLKLVEEARKKTKEIIIFANITYSGDKGLSGWAKMAKDFENSGSHAIELNFCCPNMSFNVEEVELNKSDNLRTGASLGLIPEEVESITKAVKSVVKIPVFAKLTPEGGNIVEVARSAIKGGADGITGVGNRLGMPPLDIDNPAQSIYRLQEGISLGCISGPWLKPLALKDVYQMRVGIGPNFPIIGTGGITNYKDSIEMTMVGADLIGICTEVMLKGFDILPKLIRDTTDYLIKHGKKSFKEIRDSALIYFKPVDKLNIINGYAEIDPNKCSGCGLCERIAHCHAIKLVDKKAIVKIEDCLGCSTCVDICPKKAIKMVRMN